MYNDSHDRTLTLPESGRGVSFVPSTAHHDNNNIKNNDNDNNNNNWSVIPPTIQKCTWEVPLQIDQRQDSRWTCQHGDTSRLSVFTSFPISRRLLGTIQGTSGTRGRLGQSSAQLALQYRLLQARRYNYTTIESIMVGVDLLEKIQLRFATKCQLGSSSTVTLGLVSPSLPLQLLEPRHWTLSCATQTQTQTFSSQLSLRTHATWSLVQPNRSTCGVALSSPSSRHKWQLGLSWMGFRPNTKEWISSYLLKPRLSILLAPELFQRRFATTMSWNLTDTTVWSCQVQSQSPTARSPQIVIGWNRLPGKAWSCLVSLSRSGYTLRIPLFFSSAIPMDPVLYPLRFLYASLCLQMVQEIPFLLQSFLPNRLEDPSSLSSTTSPKGSATIDQLQKAVIALDQQRLMTRQANSRMDAERKRNGLIIVKALYHVVDVVVENNDTDAKSPLVELDVTIPLQFWVSDSTLRLTSSSKRNLLGFYDLRKDLNGSPQGSSKSVPVTSVSLPGDTMTPNLIVQLREWLTGFWRPACDARIPVKEDEDGDDHYRLRLQVDYTYGGITHQIVIDDEDELILPVSTTSTTTSGS